MRESTRRLIGGARNIEEWRAMLGARLQPVEPEEDDFNQPDDDEEPTDEKDKKRKDKKRKDPDDPEDSEGEHDDDEAVAREAYSAREAVAKSIVRLGAKARNEPEPREFIPGPAPFRTIKATAKMFDEVRAKIGTPYTPVAPTLTDPDPTRRVAAAILEAGAAREKARLDPPLPDSTNAAALFMIQRSLARIEAQKQFRKTGIVRP